MKRIVAFFLLLCHMNNSMFLPQVEEVDVYDKNGVELDDINSVIELVRVEMGYDTTPDDEDSDNGQNFHLVKSVEYNFQQAVIVLERDDFAVVVEHEFDDYRIPALQSPNYDILTPPPDLA
jgi:hypothetical protein